MALIDNVQLTLLVGPTVVVPAPRVVMDALQSVEVTSSAGARSGFQLTFGIANDRRCTRSCCSPRTRPRSRFG